MKYKKIITAFLLMVAFGVLSFSTVQAASVFRSSNTTSTKQNETISGSVYLAGNNVTVKGIIDGDVFCAGQNVTVDAEVKGDVLCAGQNVRIDGNIDGDVRVAGQNVTVTGHVTQSATLAGQIVTLEKSSRIGRDLTVTGNQTVFEGKVERDFVLHSEESTIHGKIGRDLVQAKQNQDRGIQKNETPLLVTAWFFTATSLLLVSLVLVWLFPRQLKGTAEHIDFHPWQTLAIGFVASFMVPIVLFLLFVSLIGIPLALFMLLVWGVILFLSGPVTGFAIGKLLLRGRGGVVLTALLGGVALVTLYFVPILSFFILLLAMWFGSGAVLKQLYRHIDTHQKVIETKPQKIAKKK